MYAFFPGVNVEESETWRMSVAAGPRHAGWGRICESEILVFCACHPQKNYPPAAERARIQLQWEKKMGVQVLGNLKWVFELCTPCSCNSRKGRPPAPGWGRVSFCSGEGFGCLWSCHLMCFLLVCIGFLVVVRGVICFGRKTGDGHRCTSRGFEGATFAKQGALNLSCSSLVTALPEKPCKESQTHSSQFFGPERCRLTCLVYCKTLLIVRCLTPMKTRSTVPEPPVGVTLTIPHFKREETFKRRTFVVNVLHCRQAKPPKPEIANILRARLCLPDANVIYLSKFRTIGPHSRSFSLINDSVADAQLCEPPYKLKKMGIPLEASITAKDPRHRIGKNPHGYKKIFGNKKKTF